MDSKVITIGERLAMELSGQPLPEVAAPVEAAPEAPAATEAAAPAKTVAPPPDLDNRMAKLAEASRKAQAERDAIRTERQKLEADLRELAEFRAKKAAAKEDPVSWAEFGGFDAPDAYATTLMEKGQLTPERKRVLELEKQTRDQAARLDRMDAERAAAEQTQMQRQVMGQLKAYGEQNNEQFDLVNRLNAHEQVMGVIQEHFKATIDPETGVGEVMSYAQAYQAVEDWLDSQLAPALESPKIRSRLGAASASQTPERPSSGSAPRHVGTVSSRTRAVSAPERPQTEAERMQKAGEYLFAQLAGRNR